MIATGPIGICAIFKDEGSYLHEWVEFHKRIGVDYFILFDNGSTDGGKEAILGSTLKDYVSVVDWPERPGQITAYQHCIDNYAPEFEWMAFIDVDEFIHPLRDANLPDLLRRAGEHPAMLLQWMNFGPGGHRTRPAGSVLEEYTLRMPLDNPVNRHVKSIIRMSAFIRAGGCHIAQLRGDPCDADGVTIKNEAIQSGPPSQTAVLNHYYTKSWADWIGKVQRGRATVADDPAIQRKLDWFSDYETRATIPDTRIQRFLPSKQDPVPAPMNSSARPSHLGLPATEHLPRRGYDGPASEGIAECLERDGSVVDRSYAFEDLLLLRPQDLQRRGSIGELRGTEEACCEVFTARPEIVATPTIIYNGGHPLRATEPNLFAESNPNRLFPTVTQGHAIWVACLPNALCVDGGIIVTQSSRLYSESFRTISRTGQRVGLLPIGGDRFRLETIPVHIRYLPGKCMFLDGEHFAAYGHFLGEILTRLWIGKFVDLAEFTIVCGRVSTPHLLPLLEAFGIRKDRIVLNDSAIVCEELWVASQSFLVRRSTTISARSTWKVIADYYDRGEGPTRVYISRSRATSRVLLNETEAEDLFRSRGFEVVYPETLAVSEQINLFHHAKWLAGCSGSNMFNCAFSGLEQEKFILTSRNYILHTDVLMNIDCRRPVTYFIGEPEREIYALSSWRVDLELLREAIDRWLKSE